MMEGALFPPPVGEESVGCEMDCRMESESDAAIGGNGGSVSNNEKARRNDTKEDGRNGTKAGDERGSLGAGSQIMQSQASGPSWASIVERNESEDEPNLEDVQIREVNGKKELFIAKTAHEKLKAPFQFAAIATLSGGGARNRS